LVAGLNPEQRRRLAELLAQNKLIGEESAD
jgi:hypothetical protein